MTFVSSIDGHLLKEMLLAGVSLLEKNKAAVDALNVFPVPDGDTGTNMSLTMMAAAREVSPLDTGSISQVANAVARGALKGARGNSGVILSQLFRGFAQGLDNLESADAAQFANALKLGSEAAYKAVMKPKEGTILTVAREIAEKVTDYASRGGDLYGLLENIITWGEDTLKRTPEMLPVLKQAGVVDSGGQGLLIIYMGYKAAVDGESIEDIGELLDLKAQAPVLEMEGVSSEIEFGYCTEFLVQQLKEGVGEQQTLRLREKLGNIGDSVVVVSDLGMIKVHVHTDDPGKALQYALSLGSLSSIKIDNMREQHSHIIVNEAELDAQQAEAAIDKKSGIVAVCSGEGLVQLMRDLGATEVVTGGQTMNPSTEDILTAARKTGARDVYLLPNNPNIILAAQQAAELSTQQRLHLVPTRTVPQGVAALVAFMPDRDPQGNVESMKEAAASVRSGSVTYAVRDTAIEEKTIKEGDIMGLNEKIPMVVGSDVAQVTAQLVDEMLDEDMEMLTLYYGEDIQPHQAEELAESISARHQGLEIEVVEGGQPLYYYLVSVE